MRPKIGRMLLLKKWISAEQLREALEVQRARGEKLGHWLVKLGYITEEKLIATLSEQLSVPWMNEIKQPFNQEALSALPGMLCKRFNVFPLEFAEGDQLTMAVDCGFTDEMIDAVDEVVGVRVKPFLTRMEVLRQLIEEHEASQLESTADVIADKLNFAGQVGQRFVKKWFDLEAERARFGLFEGTLWIRYLKGEVASDYFMLFDETSASAS
ncbi:MAG: GspE/PulE/PilB domain-containing protein, partial [bacterium]